MAYKEKLEQQDSQRRRKFSTHLDIPDRDVLFRSEVSIPFYYGYHRKTPCPKEKLYSYIPYQMCGLRSSDNSVIGAFIHWPLSVIARMCGACAFRIVSIAIVLSALFTPQIGSSCWRRKDTWSLDFSLISKRQHDRNFPLRIFGSAASVL